MRGQGWFWFGGWLVAVYVTGCGGGGGTTAAFESDTSGGGSGTTVAEPRFRAHNQTGADIDLYIDESSNSYVNIDAGVPDVSSITPGAYSEFVPVQARQYQVVFTLSGAKNWEAAQFVTVSSDQTVTLTLQEKGSGASAYYTLVVTTD